MKFVADINKCQNLSQAQSCSKNHGAINNGIHTNSEHHMFVDDNLIAEIHDHVMQAMAASIEALFLVLGPDMHTIHRSNLSMKKFYQSICSYKKSQLGLSINTRTMIVSLPTEKFNEITALLKNWHSNRKTFIIKEAATLLGKLKNAATVCTWARFLFLSLRHVILLALRASRRRVHNNKNSGIL